MTHNSNIENGFVGCTLVRVANTDVSWKRIDDIQVGDMVMAMPENGKGETVPKRVLNTFKHENKAVWYVGVTPHADGMGYTEEGFATTAEHPFCVYGYAPDVLETGEDNSIAFYDNPKWKQVNELLQGDVLYDAIKEKHYLVNSIKPFAKSFVPEYAWLQGGEMMVGWQFELEGTDWDLESKRKSILGARIVELGIDLDENDDNIIVDETVEPYPIYALDGLTGGKAIGTQYAPYTTTVYNLEDNHTFCIGTSGMVVHDTQEATYDS